MRPVAIHSASVLLLGAVAQLALACAHNPLMPAPAHSPGHPAKTTPITTTPVEDKKVAFARRVGEELYERHRAIWIATDLLRSKISPQKSRGWLTERRGDEWVVLALGAMEVPTTSSDIEVTHTVVYDPATDRARIENRIQRVLNLTERAAYRARTLVEKALPNQKPLCGMYKVVVMPAEAAGTGRRGWLVYALVAMPRAGIYPVGGFHEFLVSDNGAQLVETRVLSRDCLSLGGDKLAAGESLTAFTVTDIISDAPLPQHVFVSLLSKTPVFVFTVQNRRTWKVVGDQIELVGQ